MQPVFFRSVIPWEIKSGIAGSSIPFQKIPNVVNTRYFYPSVSATGRFIPVHSYFDLALSKKSGGNYPQFYELIVTGFTGEPGIGRTFKSIDTGNDSIDRITQG